MADYYQTFNSFLTANVSVMLHLPQSSVLFGQKCSIFTPYYLSPVFLGKMRKLAKSLLFFQQLGNSACRWEKQPAHWCFFKVSFHHTWILVPCRQSGYKWPSLAPPTVFVMHTTAWNSSKASNQPCYVPFEPHKGYFVVECCALLSDSRPDQTVWN